jgi:XTP/dITP diphosphohydrolase
MTCLADDSGLVVDALGGEPGVRSARFAGVEGRRNDVDSANNRLLLDRLGNTPVDKRTARFVCAMVLFAPATTGRSTNVPIVVQGTIEGYILTLEEAGDDARGRGRNGFGYDPLFLVPSLGRTTAELDPPDKNRISHRGNAARLMWKRLRDSAFVA